MLRGSRPGERRGGRKQGTPNRRTILRDRILSIGSDQPAASQRAFLLKLVKDRKLPAETRMAVATPAVVPAIRDWNPHTRDALFGVVQDATADPKARSKAALKIAEFLLPKAGRRAKVIPDEYGFSISPNLARAYREIQLELRALARGSTQKIPANAEKIEKLEARSDAIRQRFQLPCPTKSKYGDKEVEADWERLIELNSLRNNKTGLTEAQKAEEAHLRARLDVYHGSPESIARRRRQALEDADRWFKKSRLFGDRAPPLSRKDRSDLKLLRWLFPEPNRNLFRFDGDEIEMNRDYPFAEELLAPDGNFYPGDSKLRPTKPLFPLEGPKGRIYELEKRRVAEKLSAVEEEELQDLWRRHPRIAEVVGKMNLVYDHWFSYELKIAQKAGLDPNAAMKQAEVYCLRLKKDGCLSYFDLVQLRDDGTWPWHSPASPPADNAT
jgi:hypothetical protein